MNAKKLFWTINCVVAVILAMSIIFSVYCAKELNSTRGLCDCYRERINSATATVTELKQSTERNIESARDCVELIEEIREEVSDLEMQLSDFSWDDYYDNLDNDLGFEPLD